MKIVLDEGYQFGLGGFETLGIQEGKPLFLKEHLKRLEKCLEFLNISLRVTEEEIVSYLGAIQEEYKEHGVLKIMVSGENKIVTARANPYKARQYEQGFSLDYSKIIRNETSPFTFHKTTNYGDCILEKRNALAAGFDDYLFSNSRGELSECTSGNIFFVKGKQIYTPQVSCGLLSGVIRSWVCARFQAEETIIGTEEIKNYDGCFMTNSLMGVMPVRRIGRLEFEASSLISGILEAYKEHVSKFMV